jgi:hypothetical protein
MKLSRWRSGEWLLLAGTIALAALLGLRWFAVSTPQADLRASESGIAALGWLATFLLLAAIVAAVAQLAATATQTAAALPVTLSVVAFTLAFLALVAILVRLVLQPGLGIDAGNADVDLRWPAFAGALAALAMAAGAWRAMADERLDHPESHAQRDRVLAAAGGARPAPPRGSTTPSAPPDGLADPPR